MLNINIMRMLILGCSICWLAACVSGPYPISSPFFIIPAGSQIEVNQQLTIPSNSGRVYLQYGKVVSAKEKDRYQPHCWFLSWKVLETPQVIKPDTFTVVSTQKQEDLVQRDLRLKLASNSPRASAGIGITIGGTMDPLAGDAPLATEYITQIHIHSDGQPDIRMLECNHWDDPSSGEHLTVEQMQAALGQLATIIIN